MQERFNELLSTAPYGNSQTNFAGQNYVNDCPNPGIHVDTLGSIGLPVSQHDAGRLMSISKRATCGKRGETVLDISVRRCWQICPSQVNTRNPSWMIYLRDKLLPQVGDKLGLGPRQLDLEFLYMLIFGEGDYYKAHQW